MIIEKSKFDDLEVDEESFEESIVEEENVDLSSSKGSNSQNNINSSETAQPSLLE